MRTLEPTHVFEKDGREYHCRALPPHLQNSEDYLDTLSKYSRSVKRTYYASIDGHILSVTTKDTVRVMNARDKLNQRDGTFRKEVKLSIDGRKSYRLAHRLVASAWCTGEGETCPYGGVRNQVNHINKDTTDNRAQNLHWVSEAENKRHARYQHPLWELERRTSAGEGTEDDLTVLVAGKAYLDGHPLEDLVEAYGQSAVHRALKMFDLIDYQLPFKQLEKFEEAAR